MKSSILIAFLLVINLFGTEVIEESENGSINWSEGTVTAYGMGYAKKSFNKLIALQKAKRASKLDAMRNLLEIVGSVQVDSTTTLEDKMLDNDEVKTKVNGFIRDVLDVKYEELDELTVKATIKMRLDDSIYSAFMENDEIGADSSAFSGKKATGLIIDARDTSFKPTLSPKLLEEYVGIIYPADIVKRDNISKRFIVNYLRDLDAAQKHPLVGEYPIVIKAKSINGDKSDQLILDKQSSDRIKKEVQLKALNEARVIIVIK